MGKLFWKIMDLIAFIYVAMITSLAVIGTYALVMTIYNSYH